MRRLLALALAGLMLLLAACGTKGPLYLPQPGTDTDNDTPRTRR